MGKGNKYTITQIRNNHTGEIMDVKIRIPLNSPIGFIQGGRGQCKLSWVYMTKYDLKRVWQD